VNQNDVIQYIRQQFGVQPNYRLAQQWNACVFASPVNGRWFALLEQPQGETGRAYLDIQAEEPGLGEAHRMHKAGWHGVILDDQTPVATIQAALSRAFKQSLQSPEGAKQTERLIYVPPVRQTHIYHDQPLPQLGERALPFAKHKQLPAPLQKMRKLYDYTLPPASGRAKNFYVQGQSVADYTDDYRYQGDFHRYFPVYHDMTTAQLRGYFAWRTKIRQGEYVLAPDSFAYVYLYELINQIGVKTPEEGYQKLRDFQHGYAKLMDPRMGQCLQQWLRDYTIYYQLPDSAMREQFQEQIAADDAYWTLVKPTEQPAAAVTAALENYSSYDFGRCPLKKRDPALTAAIVKAAWCRLCHLPDENVESNLLGWQGESTTRPFANAVFYDRQPQRRFSRQVDALCSYHYHDGRWEHRYCVPAQRRAQKIGCLLHEIDRLIRQEFHLGRRLKPRPLAQAMLTQIEPAIAEARHQIEEERRPKIKINLANLDQIRADASVTRESLLTDEEKAAERAEEQRNVASVANTVPQPAAPQQPAEESPASDSTSAASGGAELGLTKDESYLLVHLLAGTDWQDYVRQHHLMVSILVDGLNEKLFDEIGDTVIEFDDQDQPAVIDDYREDLEDLLK
jgi:predicted DNA-binding protein (MmcQ/YjbR family)